MGSILKNVIPTPDTPGHADGSPAVQGAIDELADKGGGMLLLVVPPSNERDTNPFAVPPFTATMTFTGTVSKEAVQHVMAQISDIVCARMFPYEPGEQAVQPINQGEPSV